MSTSSFLWHDYETFGARPRSDRPAQFAAIRTDAELNEIGEPLMLYCQPAPDFLPDPVACLITGITPQVCLERGLPEYQFAAQIEQAFSQPGTIGVGYNTIRFDDEFTRFLFWRNLIDPYAREWQNNCGRWDLLDVVRTTYALRPEGMVWPRNADNKVSFKLEDLARANGLQHDAAHDALSDVRATIALARLIRQRQPKLFDFCLALHKKEKVNAEIGLPIKKPFLHVSGMFPVEQACLSVVWPLALHPQNKNEVIVWDLRYDPSELTTLDAETIRQRLFTRSDDLPEGVSRLPVKTIHINKSPIVIGNLKTLSAARAVELGLDLASIHAHAERAQQCPEMGTVWEQVFRRDTPTAVDVDEDLYGGFVSNNDRRTLNHLRGLGVAMLAKAAPDFQDGRLHELFFRYRARNFPTTLNELEAAQWQEHRRFRLLEDATNARTVQAYFAQIDALSEEASADDEEILTALYDYAELIVPSD